MSKVNCQGTQRRGRRKMRYKSLGGRKEMRWLTGIKLINKKGLVLRELLAIARAR